MIACIYAFEQFAYEVHMSLCLVHFLDEDYVHRPLGDREVEEQMLVFLQASEDRVRYEELIDLGESLIILRGSFKLLLFP